MRSGRPNPSDYFSSPLEWRLISREDAFAESRHRPVIVVYSNGGVRNASWLDSHSPFYLSNGPYHYSALSYFLYSPEVPKKDPSAGSPGKPKPKGDPGASDEPPPEPVKEEVNPYLKLTKVDERFAPGAETLEIRYEIKALQEKPVTLTITSAHHKPAQVLKLELPSGDKADGKHAFNWDGKANAASGPLKGLYLNPLHAPYKAKLSGGGIETEEKEFTVLYHSLELRQGPWTTDEKEPDASKTKDWAAYKLNELGYFGGPVGHDTKDYLKKAIIRYKANHRKLHRLKYSEYNDAITGDLKDALKAGDNRRDWFDGNAVGDKTATSILKVEALTYEEGEFGVTNKTSKEKARLNRPLIPLEAVLFLKGKAGGKVLAPDGVGPVRVNWRATDPGEDLTQQWPDTPADFGFPRKYIGKALATKGGDPAKGDNCHVDFGGIRRHPDADIGPFFQGKSYVPYEVAGDKKQKLCFSKACIDKDKYPLRLGKAGAFFRPSIIAGDDYALRAEIDFTGLPNQGDLEKAHGVTDEKTRIAADTGAIRIRRFNQLAVVVKWPARTASSEWDKIEEEFGKAYLDLDVKHSASKPVTDVLTEAQYKAIVKGHTKHHNPAKIRLDPDSLVGVDLPVQGNLNAKQYKKALRSFVNDNYWDKIYEPLRKRLSENIRKDFPNGFIVIEFLAHKPLNIQKDPKNGDFTVSAANTGFVTWTFSIGLSDSVVFADQKDPDKVYYVVSHEMGHNFWLLHWENTGESNGSNHDRKDHDCVMSYSDGTAFPHQTPGVYTPHFCGKCNLKLRGWDITHKGIPKDSG